MNAADKVETAAKGNGFAQVLAQHRDGFSLEEASEKLTELVQRVRQTGRSGTITVALKVGPASKGAGNALIIHDKITVRLPEMDREASIMFANDDHQLQREDPRQKKLAFAALPSVPVDVQPLPKARAVNE